MTDISRVFTTLNTNNVVLSYQALVRRNHLHYATTILVRDPHCKKNIYLGIKCMKFSMETIPFFVRLVHLDE